MRRPAGTLLVFVIGFTAPRRHSTSATVNKIFSTLLIALVSIANAGQLALLIKTCLAAIPTCPAGRCLTGALAIFITNIIMFGLWYWELDSPGLSGRVHRGKYLHFQFPQLGENKEKSGWLPNFFDYLYVSITNSTAFSPTDTLPLTHTAKSLMSIQALYRY